jgi:hypothetical protein
MAGEKPTHDELRADAAKAFGLPRVEPGVSTELERGFEEAHRTMRAGDAAVAIAASGMDSEVIKELQLAFEGETPPEAA